MNLLNKIPESLFFEGNVLMQDGKIVESMIIPTFKPSRMYYIYGNQGMMEPSFSIMYLKDSRTGVDDRICRFIGEIKNGKAHGIGKAYFKNEEK